VYGFGHMKFYNDIVGCIRDRRRAMLDGLEGRKSLELVHRDLPGRNHEERGAAQIRSRGRPAWHRLSKVSKLAQRC
jgi:hypothetical protein